MFQFHHSLLRREHIAQSLNHYGGRLYFRLFCIYLLSACGGGDSKIAQPTTTPPQALQFTISTEVNTGGSITPQATTLTSGASANFTLIAKTGYVLDKVNGCNGNLNGNIFTVTNITTDCTLQAQFKTILISPQSLKVVTDNQFAKVSWDNVTQAQNYKVYVTEQQFTNMSDLPETHQQIIVADTFVLLPIDKSYNNFYVRVAAVVDGTEFFSEEQIQISVNFKALGHLNDTAITICLSRQMISTDCNSNIGQVQDAATGRDALAASGSLLKIGQGTAGFDFTKITRTGRDLFIQNRAWQPSGNQIEGTQWSCVRDNVTGLIWEIKQSGVQSAQHSFSWYSEAPSENDGFSGDYGQNTCGLSQCNTTAYIDYMNSINFCGSRNWRLPTRFELNHILVNQSAEPKMDLVLFPDVKTNTSYWTVNTYYPNSNFAWAVSMNSGMTFWQPKSSHLSVRLVHSR